MNLRHYCLSCRARAMHRATGESGFTMIEIAIALGVIVFALVAIIGILPTGLNVEKETREQTLINQDGPYFLEAIKGGSEGIAFLTNYVDSIRIDSSFAGGQTNMTYTNSPFAAVPPDFNGNMVNSKWIVGLLTRPKYFNPTDETLTNQVNNPLAVTNRIEALVHSLSGAAIEQGKVTREIAFSYSILVEVVPVNTHALFTATNAPTFDAEKRDDAFTRHLEGNLYDVRLNFRWPLLPNGDVGPGRKLFRTFVSGQIFREGQPDGTTLCLFRPQSFTSPK